MVKYGLLVAAIVLTSVGTAAQAPDGSVGTIRKVDLLAELNDTARKVYADGRAQLLAAADPVIIVGSELVLRHAGKVVRADYTPALYTQLKQIAHLPLGVFGALAPRTTGVAPADEKWRAELADLEASAVLARGLIPALDLDDRQKWRQLAIVDGSTGFIQRYRSGDAPDWDALQAYARKMAPLVLANTTDAANAQLDAMHKIVAGWRTELGEDAWNRAYVLVLGPKTPREGNLAMQYFTAALGPGAAGTRVIYAESIFDEQAALKLLGGLLIDRKLGEAFFGDAGRMERDLLADAATVKVNRLFGRLGAQ